MRDVRCTVALVRQTDYDQPAVDAAVADLFRAADFAVTRDERVLVKPNLLKAGQEGLICTHPSVVRAVCTLLLDHGARVTVGDSPAFGSGASVARKIGLMDALADLDVPVVTLGRPRTVRLPFGHAVGVSRYALDADRIVNLPKLKAHCQMRLTLAVKNLFGCVTGVRKAIAHTRHGDIGVRFESLLLELADALPPAYHILDGVTAMHVKGPGGGDPFPLGLLGASQSGVALDTAVCALLQLTPKKVPLWAEARRRRLAGSRMRDLDYPLLTPLEFEATGFVLPDPLDAVSFHPARLAWSAVKRAAARLA